MTFLCTIEAAYSKDFEGYNERMFQTGGSYRGSNAHKRIWNTEQKKAVFTTPKQLNALSAAKVEECVRVLRRRPVTPRNGF
jgi:hypothetical protein